MNHKDKLKKARQLITPAEIKEGISVWASKGWIALKKRRQLNKLKKIIIKKKKKNGTITKPSSKRGNQGRS